MLVTSRETLRLRGEHEYPLKPLPLPDLNQAPEKLAQYASVALFIQRAQAVRPNFTLDNTTAPAIAEICTYLDGLPLAIELAAAHVRIFSPQVLLARLKSQPHLQLLSAGARDLPTRQQTLQNTLEWSYNLLTEQEQTLFRRLGVFAGGFTLPAVERVCYAQDEAVSNTVDNLASLIEKSLIRRNEDDGDQARFTQLFVIRQFALSILEKAGELRIIRQAHAAHYLTLAESVEPDDPIHISTPSELTLEVVNQLDTEMENLRAALRWSLKSQDLELSLRLVNALEHYWYIYNHYQEAVHWGEAVASMTQGQQSLRRAKMLRNLADSMSTLNPVLFAAQIETYLAKSLELYSGLNSPENTCVMYYYQGSFEWGRGNRRKAITFLEKCVECARIHDMKYLEAIEGSTLAWFLVVEGEPEKASLIAQESLALARDIDEPLVIVSCLINLGWSAIQQDKIDLARQCLSEVVTQNLPDTKDLMENSIPTQRNFCPFGASK